MNRLFILFATVSILSLFTLQPLKCQIFLDKLSPSTISDWQQEGGGKWNIVPNSEKAGLKGVPPDYLLYWIPDEKSSTGILRSEVFTIDSAFQVFDIAGSWGRSASGGPAFNRIRLVSHPDG